MKLCSEQEETTRIYFRDSQKQDVLATNYIFHIEKWDLSGRATALSPFPSPPSHSLRSQSGGDI